MDEKPDMYMQVSSPNHIIQFTYNNNPLHKNKKWVVVWNISTRICVLHKNGVTDQELLDIMTLYNH